MSTPLIYGCMTLGGSWGQESVPASQYDVAREAVYAAHRAGFELFDHADIYICLLYTSPSPRDATLSRMPSSA